MSGCIAGSVAAVAVTPLDGKKMEEPCVLTIQLGNMREHYRSMGIFMPTFLQSVLSICFHSKVFPKYH